MLQLKDPQGGPNVAQGTRGALILSPPASGGVVTPSDSVVYNRPIMVWVGDVGPVDVHVVPYGRNGDASITYTLKAGMTVPIACKQVLASGTTAVNLFLGSALPSFISGGGGGGSGPVTADSTTVTADTTSFTADNG